MQMTQKKVQNELEKFVPSELLLKPYQYAGVKQILEAFKKERGVLLADEAGLGKTIQAAVVINAYQPQHTVIISPAAVLYNWKRELEKWLLDSTKLHLVKKGTDWGTSGDRIIIVSYAIAAQPKWTIFLKSYLAAARNSLLIIDECHYLKSWRAKRTKSILQEISLHTSLKLLPMSASPQKKAASDLHPILSALQPGKWGTYKEFGYKYCYAMPNPHSPSGVEFCGVKKDAIKELRSRIRPIVIRRFKRDVLKELPKVIYSTVYLDVETQAGRELLTYEDQIKSFIDSQTKQGTDQETAELKVPTKYSQFRRQLGLDKLPAVIEWLDNFLEEDDTRQFVLYGYHKDVIHALTTYLDNKGISFGAITGSTPAKERDNIQLSFHARKIQVICANILAGGIGANWQCASTIIFAELDWDAINMYQAIKRVDRIGQKNPINCHFLVASDTIDDRVVELIATKQRDFNKLFGRK